LDEEPRRVSAATIMETFSGYARKVGEILSENRKALS